MIQSIFYSLASFLKCAAFMLLSFMLVSCSAETKKPVKKKIKLKIKQKDKLPHDPFSARLVAATELAKAEDFKTELLNGKIFQLSEHRGEVVVLNIWATWCAPCIAETKDLVDVYEKYKDDGLVILGTSVDEQGRSVVVPFIKKYDVTYPITIDDGPVQEKYPPAMGIPTTYIIGKKGYIRYYAAGALSKKELKPRLERLLNE